MPMLGFREIASIFFPVFTSANSWVFFLRKRRRDSKAIDNNMAGAPDWVASGAAIPMVYGTVRTLGFITPSCDGRRTLGE